MAPTVRPHSQDTCGIGFSLYSALRWPEVGLELIEWRWSDLHPIVPTSTFYCHSIPLKLTLSLVCSSPNCWHKLIVFLDGWHSAWHCHLPPTFVFLSLLLLTHTMVWPLTPSLPAAFAANRQPLPSGGRVTSRHLPLPLPTMVGCWVLC